MKPISDVLRRWNYLEIDFDRYFAGNIIFGWKFHTASTKVTKDKCWPLRKALNLKFGAKVAPNQYRRLSKSSRESFARITQFSSKMSVSFLNVSRTFRKRDTFLLKNTARFKMTTMKKNSLEKLSENLERRERKREEKEKGIKGELPPPSISANKPFRCTLSPPGDQQCSQRKRAKLKPANEAERPSIIEEYRAAR